MQCGNDFSREVIILTGASVWRRQQVQAIIEYYADTTAVYCGDQLPTYLADSILFFSFKQSRNLLGQEFSLAFFDASHQEQLSFHLDSLAIIAATLKAGGKLFILLPEWQGLTQTLDWDTLRWNSLAQATSSANFLDWFKQLSEQYQIPIYSPQKQPELTPITSSAWQIPTTALQDQQRILQRLLQPQAAIYLLLAGRGRGKSAVAGQFIQQATDKILVTAANRQAITTLMKFASNKSFDFIAPDELVNKLSQQQLPFYQWLIVDEAAMLPLSMLQTFCQAFPYLLLTSTSEGYEGSGQGFRLKLELQISRQLCHLTLEVPLRWQQEDLLERWLNQLVLLQPTTVSLAFQPQSNLTFVSHEQIASTQQLQQYYQLLSLAHYRTSPTDLRRLMDGKKQQFLACQLNHTVVGVIWGLQEGGIVDQTLLDGIRLGYRRPKGNLVAQALCFQTNNVMAAKLHSLRISRIAVLPNWQQKGIGTQLVQQLIQQCQTTIDYLSVSFGYSEQLLSFWQRCGFRLLALSSGTEASSGNYSVMMAYPLSTQGEQFCQQAEQQFLRHLALSEHLLLPALSRQSIPVNEDWQLTAEDWCAIRDFVEHQRTLFVTYPALQRLFKRYPNQALAQQLQMLKRTFVVQQKQKLQQFKQQVVAFLQEI